MSQESLPMAGYVLSGPAARVRLDYIPSVLLKAARMYKFGNAVKLTVAFSKSHTINVLPYHRRLSVQGCIPKGPGVKVANIYL